MDTFEEIQYGQVNLGILSTEVQETCVDTSSPPSTIAFEDTCVATSMASFHPPKLCLKEGVSVGFFIFIFPTHY